MADLADNAPVLEDYALKRHQANRKASPERGECLNCGAPVEHLYCDAFCREDYERSERVARRTRCTIH